VAFWCVCLLWWLGRFKAVWLSMCICMRVVKMVRFDGFGVSFVVVVI